MTEKYNNEGISGISAAILLASIILIAGAAASITMNSSGEITEDDFEQIIDEALNEISTYLQIKDIIGKYYDKEGEKYIQKVSLLVKPFFTFDLDMSNLIIQISNGKQIQMLYYCGHAELIHANPLFEHPIWQKQNNSNFGLIILLDKDKSLINFNTINDQTDMVYITMKLSENFIFKYGESIQINIFPSTGITRTITIKAPAPLTPIVNLK